MSLLIDWWAAPTKEMTHLNLLLWHLTVLIILGRLGFKTIYVDFDVGGKKLGWFNNYFFSASPLLFCSKKWAEENNRKNLVESDPGGARSALQTS